MKCVTCNSTQNPTHSARPTPLGVENYNVCPACGHQEPLFIYEGILGGSNV